MAIVSLCAVDPKDPPFIWQLSQSFPLQLLKSHLFIPSQGLTPFSSAALSYHPISFLVLKTGIQYHRVCSPPRSFTGICHSKSDFSPRSGPSAPCRAAVYLTALPCMCEFSFFSFPFTLPHTLPGKADMSPCFRFSSLLTGL